jgi:hypothetical protein
MRTSTDWCTNYGNALGSDQYLFDDSGLEGPIPCRMSTTVPSRQYPLQRDRAGPSLGPRPSAPHCSLVLVCRPCRGAARRHRWCRVRPSAG